MNDSLTTPHRRGLPSRESLRKALPVLAVVLVVASLAANAYLGFRLVEASGDPAEEAKAEMERLVAEVGELMVLPQGEDPTIATVSDPEKLKEQAFFVNAQMGDKVLLYTNAKKAILYSPTAHKIVEVAPINLGAATEPATTP